MFEIIAQCSLYIDSLTNEECKKISRFGYCFEVGVDENGERVLFLLTQQKSKADGEKSFYDLINEENEKRAKENGGQITYDKSKIRFIGRQGKHKYL